MFRKFTLLLSLVLAMGFAITSTAAAQDVPTSAGDVEGLETGYARMYMPDFSAMIEAAGTPGATTGFDENAVLVIMTAGFTFDSEDNAGKALDTFGEGFTSEMSGAENLEAAELDDLGDRAVLYSGTVEESGESMPTNTLLVQDGEAVYMISVTGGDLDEGKQQAQDIATHMLDGEIETGDVTFNEDGTSTGGVFDLMPTAEDTDLVSGLAPSMDMDFSGMGGHEHD